MAEQTRRELALRLCLYGGGALAAAVLVWAGFVREATPEPGTQLSAVEVQLRLAAGMPERDSHGKPLPARQEMLRDAHARLALVAAELPEEPLLWEYRAFLAYLEGEPQLAATHYATARGFCSGNPVTAENLLQNEARMLSLCGRTDDAVQLLCAPSGASVARGQLVEAMGRDVAAQQAYAAALHTDPTADYFLARLKLKGGESDKAIDHIERGLRASGDQVRELLRSERTIWAPVVGDRRLETWLVSSAAASPLGR